MLLPDGVCAARQRGQIAIAAGVGGLSAAGVIWLVGAWLATVSGANEWINPLLPVLVGLSVPIASMLAWWLGRNLRVVGFEGGDLLCRRFGQSRRIRIDDGVRVLRWSFVRVPVYRIRSAGRFWGRWAVGIGYRPGQLDALFVLRGVVVEDRIQDECQGS